MTDIRHLAAIASALFVLIVLARWILDRWETPPAGEPRRLIRLDRAEEHRETVRETTHRAGLRAIIRRRELATRYHYHQERADRAKRALARG